ncbi:MAG: hypothetical protein EKK64_04250 [Neisseriaceae bacterium]|nr:MAG: hypothetical protein EKK64_04250 [Neisseriaceae bacterium]
MKSSNVCVYAKNWVASFQKKLKEKYGDSVTVFISHNRMFYFQGSSFCMSKSKFMKMATPINPETKIEDTIDQCGGYTSVAVLVGENRYTAKFNFGRNENFCRSFGSMVAIRKAMSKMSEDGENFVKSIR